MKNSLGKHHNTQHMICFNKMTWYFQIPELCSGMVNTNRKMEYESGIDFFLSQHTAYLIQWNDMTYPNSWSMKGCGKIQNGKRDFRTIKVLTSPTDTEVWYTGDWQALSKSLENASSILRYHLRKLVKCPRGSWVTGSVFLLRYTQSLH